MTNHAYNVLFLCTSNAAHSIMAEALVTIMGQGRFQGFSAGSRPGCKVNPFAAEQVQQVGYPSNRLRSKSWHEFTGRQAPTMDFIITVCDSVASESCPVWPGRPVTAHWSFADPAAVEGTEAEKRAAFEQAFQQIRARISLFVRLPIEMLDTPLIKQEIQKIGETTV